MKTAADPIEDSRPRPGAAGSYEGERGGLSAISFVDTNWALCSHSMEAWNAARGMVGRKGRGKEGLPACILFIVSLISRERCLDEVLGLGFR